MRKKTVFYLLKDCFIDKLWVLSVSILFFLFYFVVSVLFGADLYLSNSALLNETDLNLNKYYLYKTFLDSHEAGGNILLFLGLFAMLTAFTAFAYLTEQRKTDFYHSLPVGRETLFIVNIAVSFIDIGVPYLVFALISAVIAGSKTGYAGTASYALSQFFCNMSFFALMYFAAVIAMLVSAVKLVAVAGMLVFFFLGPAAVLTVSSLMQSWFATFYYRYEVFLPFIHILSPALWGMNDSLDLSLFIRTAGACFMSIIFGAAGLFIYRLRRSENSGRALAFRKLETPLKFILLIPAALAFQSFFTDLTNGSADFWAVFGMVSGVVIGHFVLEIVYNLDFRSLFNHKMTLILCLAGTFAVFLFFRLDLPGFDSYIPAKSDIASAGIYSYQLDDAYVDDESLEFTESETGPRLRYDAVSDKEIVDRMRITDPEAVIAAAEAGVKYADNGIDSDNFYLNDGYFSYVLVSWHLNNGRTAYRQYYIDFGESSDMMLAVLDDPDYKRGIFPILTKSDDYADSLAGAAYEDVFGYHELDIDEGTLRELFETYRAELTDLSHETRISEMPIYNIQFNTASFKDISDQVLSVKDYSYMIYTLKNIGEYPVYPSFAGTLGILSNCGLDPRGLLDPEAIDYITVIDYSTTYDDGYGNSSAELMVTDPDEIKAVTDAPLFIPVTVSNRLYPIYYNMHVTANVGGESVSGLYFDYDNIPDFIKEYFDLNDEALAASRDEEKWW